MSTVTREKVRVALPQGGRGDFVFGVIAVLIGVLALVAKLSGLFA